MRRPILAGNWKMNMTIAEAADFVRNIRRGLNGVKGVDRVLCPPFTALSAVRAIGAGHGDRDRRPEHALGGKGRLHW